MGDTLARNSPERAAAVLPWHGHRPPAPSPLLCPNPAQRGVQGPGAVSALEPWLCPVSPCSVPLAVATAVLRFSRCRAPGPLPQQLCPGAPQGVCDPPTGSALTVGWPSPSWALTASPLSPGAAVSSREGRGKPPSVASEARPGGAACRAPPRPGWTVTAEPPAPGLAGAGGAEPDGRPSAPGAGGERGLPTLLVLPSAPPAGPLTRTEPDFTVPRPANEQKMTPNQVPSVTRLRVRRLRTGISSAASGRRCRRSGNRVTKSSALRRNLFFCCFFVSKLI